MTLEESNAEAARILAGAGWKADEGWGGFIHGTCVGGLAPDGNVYVKNWAGIPLGHPRHSADTPDEPHEAAQWLADRYKAQASDEGNTWLERNAERWESASDPELNMHPPINIQVNPVFNVTGGSATSGDSEAGATQTPPLFGELPEAGQGEPHETHSETGAEAQAEPTSSSEVLADEAPLPEGQGEPAEEIADSVSLGDDAAPAEGAGDLGGADAGESGGGLTLYSDDGSSREGDRDDDYAVDADFEEAPAELIEGADLFPVRGIAWSEDDTPDLGAEILEEHEPATTQFFMGDDIDRKRSQRIGDVVQISLAKQAAIWAVSGTTETEYRDLLGQVMHDTVNGNYVGPTMLFERFNELQSFANSAANVQAAERAKVTFLTSTTDRNAIETFDPEADWP